MQHPANAFPCIRNRVRLFGRVRARDESGQLSQECEAKLISRQILSRFWVDHLSAWRVRAKSKALERQSRVSHLDVGSSSSGQLTRGTRATY